MVDTTSHVIFIRVVPLSVNDAWKWVPWPSSEPMHSMIFWALGVWFLLRMKQTLESHGVSQLDCCGVWSLFYINSCWLTTICEIFKKEYKDKLMNNFITNKIGNINRRKNTDSNIPLIVKKNPFIKFCENSVPLWQK